MTVKAPPLCNCCRCCGIPPGQKYSCSVGPGTTRTVPTFRKWKIFDLLSGLPGLNNGPCVCVYFTRARGQSRPSVLETPRTCAATNASCRRGLSVLAPPQLCGPAAQNPVHRTLLTVLEAHVHTLSISWLLAKLHARSRALSRTHTE